MKKEDMRKQLTHLNSALTDIQLARSFVFKALDSEEDENDEEQFFFRYLPDFKVTLEEQRKIMILRDIPTGNYRYLKLTYTLHNFLWPGYCRSVIGANAFHQGKDFWGQQVIKENGDLLVVHQIGLDKKDGIRTQRIPVWFQFGIDPLQVEHVCNMKTHKIYTDLFTKDGRSMRCPSVPCKGNVIRIDGPVSVRWHQADNHPEFPNDKRNEGEWQELAAIGTEYSEGSLELRK